MKSKFFSFSIVGVIITLAVGNLLGATGVAPMFAPLAKWSGFMLWLALSVIAIKALRKSK